MTFSNHSSITSYLSVAALILVNLIPVIGVLFYQWEVFDVVFIYVLETVIIGFVNILKMAFSTVIGGKSGESTSLVHWLKLFMIPFFTVHYFFFIAIQTTFVFILMHKATQMEMIPDLVLTICTEQPHIRLAIIGLLISHLFSFQVNYIGKKEYVKTGLATLMVQPYARIVIQQFVVIVGAFFILIFNTTNVFVVLLVVLKIIADVGMHLRLHRNNS